jgi:hypothetical protein
MGLIAVPRPIMDTPRTSCCSRASPDRSRQQRSHLCCPTWQNPQIPRAAGARWYRHLGLHPIRARRIAERVESGDVPCGGVSPTWSRFVEGPLCESLRDGSKTHERRKALDQSALLDWLEALKDADADDGCGSGGVDISGVDHAEAMARIGAAPHGRTPTRMTQAMDISDRMLTTMAVMWSCGFPSCGRVGFPSLLQRRRRIDQALFVVVLDGLRARGEVLARSTTW